jgi:hypothetical protein
MATGESTAVSFTPRQLRHIEDLGQIAVNAIQEATDQGQPPPVGVWTATYNYILTVMSSQGIQGSQAYWFQEAGAINAGNLNDPAGFFVRDITALGFDVSLNDAEIQNISDTIGSRIYQTILSNDANGNLSLSFNQQLEADIGTAISSFGLPLGSWGGSFYFWNFPYITGSNVTVGQAIEADPQQTQTFITNNARAMADTIEEFGLLRIA